MGGGTARLWIIGVVVTLVFHYLWEMGQARLFKNLADVPFLRHALICLIASLGDLAIAAGLYFVAGALFRRFDWALRPDWQRPAVLCLGLGLAAAVAIERWAVAVGHWQYSPAMPTVFAIGVSPLLQWIVVPLVTLTVLRWLVARN